MQFGLVEQCRSLARLRQGPLAELPAQLQRLRVICSDFRRPEAFGGHQRGPEGRAEGETALEPIAIVRPQRHYAQARGQLQR